MRKYMFTALFGFGLAIYTVSQDLPESWMRLLGMMPLFFWVAWLNSRINDKKDK